MINKNISKIPGVKKARILMRVFFLVSILFGLAASPVRPASDGDVVILEIKGVIGGAITNYIERGINYAESKNAKCIIIAIDTPGGLMESMKEIGADMLNTKLPVIVYVYPNGSTATSAGFFLLMASDIAAMSPDTSTGSAHPVAGNNEKMDETMNEKVTNYAVKLMEQYVRRRGRNMQVAHDAVVNSISLTAEEALQKNVIEFIATSYDDLLSQLDGYSFVKGRRVVYTVYPDDLEEGALKEKLEERGLLEDTEYRGDITVPENDVEEMRDMLLEKGLLEEDAEPGPLTINSEKIDGELKEELEKRELMPSGEIELAAETLDDEIVALLQGREVVQDEGEEIVLATDGANYEVLKMSIREQFFHTIGHPNIAYILLMIGVYALIFEVTHPGAIVPGVIGALCLLVAFTSFQVLPINTLGLLLIIGAIVMFVLEVNIISHGLLTIGGVALLIAGSLMLVDSADPAMRVSLQLIAAIVGMTLLFFLIVLAAVIKTHKSRVATGAKGMVGKKGKVRVTLDPEGKVFVSGEIWNAVSETGEVLEKDVKVEVTAVDAMNLTVKKVL